MVLFLRYLLSSSDRLIMALRNDLVPSVKKLKKNYENPQDGALCDSIN